MDATLDIGVQLHLPTHGGTSVAELRELAKICAAGGASQVWVTDNLESRNLFVVLAALAPIPVRLGSAVMVQYLRNPVEAASAIATISELMSSRELVVGLGRGNPQTKQVIEMPRPIAFMREMAGFLRTLLTGGRADPRGFPVVSEYFHFVGQTPFQLTFPAPGPVRIFGGASGPLGLRAARETMDGLVFNGTLFLPALALGRVGIADRSGGHDPAPPADFGAVADLKVSVHRDAAAARAFVRPSVATRVVSLTLAGFEDDDFHALGVDPAAVQAIVAARSSGEPSPKVASFVTDSMIDAVFVAGDVGYCRERLREVSAKAAKAGFDQLMFSELGPDPMASIRLLLDEVVPHI